MWLGVEFEDHALGSEPTTLVYHGNHADRACAIRIPLEPRAMTAPPPLPTPHEVDGWQRHAAPFPFDLVSAIGYWLTDEGNAALGPEAYDKYERLEAERSAQHALGLLDVPVVNHYVECFRTWVEGRFKITTGRLTPPGCRAGIVLTHDVDDPIDPGDATHVLGLAWRRFRTGGRRLPSVYWAAGYVGRAALSRVRHPGARHWVFRDVAAAEQSRGFTSTFFFAPVSRFDREGCDLDVAYDVTDRRFRSELDFLRDSGFGIGVHLSYRALDDAAAIRRERSTVEEAAGCDVAASRHHYWHMTRPMWKSLAAHEEAGLRFDSSVSFQDLPGYRLGIALPFEPWDPTTRRSILTLQVPTVVMDTMLATGHDGELAGAVLRFERVLDALKEARGIAAVDWHEYTSVPAGQKRAQLGHLYAAILDVLADDPEVAVLDYADIEAAVRGAASSSHAASSVSEETTTWHTSP